MVARCRWSASRSAQNDSESPLPSTSRSCRMFLTQCARCHCTDSHSSRVTRAQPGNRVQSGSASSLRRYTYGCSSTDSVAFPKQCFRDDTLRSLDYTKELHVEVLCDNKTSRSAPCIDA